MHKLAVIIDAETGDIIERFDSLDEATLTAYTLDRPVYVCRLLIQSSIPNEGKAKPKKKGKK